MAAEPYRDASADPTPREIARRAAVPLAVVLVLAGIAAAVLAQGSRLDDFEWRFAGGWLALGAVSLVAYQLTLLGVWVLLMRGLGVRDLPLRRHAALWNVSLLARYVPTSALMIVVRVGGYERVGVPRRTTLVAAVYETILQIIVAVLIGAWWLLQLPEFDGAAQLLVLGIPLVGLALLHPRVVAAGAGLLLRRLGRGGTAVLLPARRLLAAAALYAVCFLLAGSGLLAVARSLHPIDGGDVPLVIASFAIGFVVAVFAFILPGGLGARETGLATVLSPALPFVVGFAVAVAVRLVQLAIELVLAGFTAWRARVGPSVTPEEPAEPPEPIGEPEIRTVAHRERSHPAA